MPVIVITKKTLLTLIAILLAFIVAGILLFTLKSPGEAAQDNAPAMSYVEQYELSMLPLNAKELPVYGVSRDDKLISLTIDAAWSTDKTEFILKTLEKYDIKATFFLCGVWVEAYPDYVKEISEKGHEIGNHSLSHPHMNKLNAAEIEHEISALDDTIESLTGKRSTLFRAPFGEYNDNVVRSVRALGYEIVQWTRDTIDWKKERSCQTILDSVLPKLTSGDIILCHNNGYCIEEYLPKLIEEAIAKGFKFVTVSELLLEGDTVIDNNGLQKSK